jgi:hypothetical protein
MSLPLHGDAHCFRALGGWLERPAKLQPPLEGRITADVIVVGAGFAGLSTALELAARGARVVVLEQEFAGFGTAGIIYHDSEGLEYRRTIGQPDGVAAGELDPSIDTRLRLQLSMACTP